MEERLMHPVSEALRAYCFRQFVPLRERNDRRHRCPRSDRWVSLRNHSLLSLSSAQVSQQGDNLRFRLTRILQYCNGDNYRIELAESLC